MGTERGKMANIVLPDDERKVTVGMSISRKVRDQAKELGIKMSPIAEKAIKREIRKKIKESKK